MTASSFEGTAKIYQFPKGGRAGLTSGRHETKLPETATAQRVVGGGAWYHEEAIREAGRVREN